MNPFPTLLTLTLMEGMHMQTYTAVGAAPAKARETFRHRVVIIGGGTAGITVAAQLARRGIHDVAVIEPSTKHYYQPLWTLVGAASPKRSRACATKRASFLKACAGYRLRRRD
jgi:Pyridine nucleotide-disulphide oxidoreductase.